ncbi:MAG: SDH family Clp fold serine proteinase, partial [Nitrososphaeraceae archaeon]
MLHTYGGEPDASYRLAQVIHDFAEEVIFLVPYHALSGGTLICLSGNKLMLGAYATLSPIDVTVDNIELASIDQFRYFAVDTRQEVEYMFKD